jgi:hypothetical protein
MSNVALILIRLCSCVLPREQASGQMDMRGQSKQITSGMYYSYISTELQRPCNVVNQNLSVVGKKFIGSFFTLIFSVKNYNQIVSPSAFSCKRIHNFLTKD